MDAKTLQALRESIEHWERLAGGNAMPGEWIYTTDCALCKMFLAPYGDDDDACLGCPVMTHTGKQFCYNTPWLAACVQFQAIGINSEQFKVAAGVQLQFLKSLLPDLI